ncbi:hypothetical protein K458DRAFT_387372 [Lentithecium fluviatile CBS 122367]|uniref:RING-type domain-containing protein n=1 Tax=Lentithecium fluviatile CBS 122367 TaxID=1168545 RepID=A0A6G1J735_9PLEO|nr:hypothetical protein K458DRAFT_387372 [Lentithecium fluviatile CBS 122367]
MAPLNATECILFLLYPPTNLDAPVVIEAFKKCSDKMYAAQGVPDYNPQTCPHKQLLFVHIRLMVLNDDNPTTFLKPLFEGKKKNGKPVHIKWLWENFSEAYITDWTCKEWHYAHVAGGWQSVVFDDDPGDEGLSDIEYEDSDDEFDDEDMSDVDSDEADELVDGKPFMNDHFGSVDNFGAYNDDFGTWPHKPFGVIGPQAAHVAAVEEQVIQFGVIDPVAIAHRIAEFMNLGDLKILHVPATHLLNHEEAVELADSLRRVKLLTIPDRDRKCPFCWGRFGEDDDGNSLAAEDVTANPVKTACGHMFHHDCFIEIVEKSSSNYPMWHWQQEED